MPPGCSCVPELVPPEAFPDGVAREIYGLNHDTACLLHGHGTPYWDRLAVHAREIAERLGLTDQQVAAPLHKASVEMEVAMTTTVATLDEFLAFVAASAPGTIEGRAMLIDQLIESRYERDDPNFLPETREEHLQNGRIGFYYGSTIHLVRDYRAGGRADGEILFPGDELRFLADDGTLRCVCVDSALDPDDGHLV